MPTEGSLAASRCTRRWAVDALLRRRRAGGRRGRQGLLRPRRALASARRRSRCTAGSATRGSAWRTCSCAGRCSSTRRPRRRRSSTSSECWQHHGIGGGDGLRVTRRPRPSSGSACASGSRTTTPVCPPRRRTTSTGRGRPRGTSRSTTPASSGCRWPTAIGGHGLPTVFDVILDEELAAAGAPPRPSLGYLVQGHPRARQRRTSSSGSSPASSAGVTAGARGSASPTPAPTWRRCAPRPSATATTTSSPATRSGRATPTTPTGASCSPAPIHEVPKHKGISAFAVPMRQPGVEQRPAADDQRDHEASSARCIFDGARVAGRQHDRRARRGLAHWR